MTAQGSSKAKAWLNVFLVLMAIYMVVVDLLDAFQHQLIFLPFAAPTGVPAQYGLPQLKVVDIRTEDGLVLKDWFKPPADKDGYIIVVFHGNMLPIAGFAPVVRNLIDNNKGIMFCEYRGFGDSPGTPSEQGVYRDARAVIKWLISRGYKPDHLIYYGGSLGSGVAVQMAVETPPAMLVLHAPYSSITDVAKRLFPFAPVDLLLEDRFDSISKISRVHVPLLVIHGTDDAVIPLRLAKALFKEANAPKRFYVVRGVGHIDIFLNLNIYAMMDKWIDGRIRLIGNGL